MPAPLVCMRLHTAHRCLTVLTSLVWSTRLQVLDRVNGIAYVALSERADAALAERWAGAAVMVHAAAVAAAHLVACVARASQSVLIALPVVSGTSPARGADGCRRWAIRRQSRSAPQTPTAASCVSAGSDRMQAAAASTLYPHLAKFYLCTSPHYKKDHTNVMMAIGTDVAVVCLESVEDERERRRLAAKLGATHTVVDISRRQMAALCGNVLEVGGCGWWVGFVGREGGLLVVMMVCVGVGGGWGWGWGVGGGACLSVLLTYLSTFLPMFPLGCSWRMDAGCQCWPCPLGHTTPSRLISARRCCATWRAYTTCPSTRWSASVAAACGARSLRFSDERA